MGTEIDRRGFVTSAAAAGFAAVVPRASATSLAPSVHSARLTRPVAVGDSSAVDFTNGGPESAVERAFRGMTEGEDVLDALVAGVNIVELDPTETGVGFGGLPNADGVVQLDACLMHGPLRRAGGVAGLEGIRTPSRVAKAVMDYTDHHLLVGHGAQSFARSLGMEVEADLNTPRSRAAWLEWKRRVDPSHYLDPNRRQEAGYAAGLSMVRDGLVSEHSFWGTVHCNGLTPDGKTAAVTTTSGLSFKIPGRAGDSPILGAGLYVDDAVGAAGSTGRGEANLFNLTCYYIVEQMRAGLHPKDAGLAGLRRIRENTIEDRLLNARGFPAFNVRFFVTNKAGEYAGVAMYASGEAIYAVCTENGAERAPLEPLLEGGPLDG